MSTNELTGIPAEAVASGRTAAQSSSERWLPTLLSVIAGMVDVIGFLSLGIFTAHVTGNIVVIGALSSPSLLTTPRRLPLLQSNFSDPDRPLKVLRF